MPLHELRVSPSLARTRQNIVVPLVSGELLKVVSAAPSVDDAGGDELGERLVGRDLEFIGERPTGPTK